MPKWKFELPTFDCFPGPREAMMEVPKLSLDSEKTMPDKADGHILVEAVLNKMNQCVIGRSNVVDPIPMVVDSRNPSI